MVHSRRGYIRLFLDRDIHGRHGKIKGQVVLRLRKPVNADGLYVHLIGTETVIRYETSYNGDYSSTYTRVVDRRNLYKDTIPLGGEGVYQSGEYGFELAVPHEAGKPGSSTVLINWRLEAVLEVSDGRDVSAYRGIRFRERRKYKRVGIVKDETETPHKWMDIYDRRTRAAYRFKDKPHDEVYAEGVLFCPQCETPYHPKRGRRQCHVCGEYLP